jgi:hypothetical protein
LISAETSEDSFSDADEIDREQTIKATNAKPRLITVHASPNFGDGIAVLPARRNIAQNE